jgi:hypothetical protein
MLVAFSFSLLINLYMEFTYRHINFTLGNSDPVILDIYGMKKLCRLSLYLGILIFV